MKTKAPLPYFGSDSAVAPALAAMLSECRHVTIPFAGGLSILPHLTARAVVANDLHEHAINFYRTASGVHGEEQQRKLIRQCNATLSHPAELQQAQQQMALTPIGADAAWAFWTLCWIGRKGQGGTKKQGGMPSIRRTAEGGTNATRLRSAAADLLDWAAEFRRCEWECCCFRELLPKVADLPDCGLYVDAPWVTTGRNYLHPFTQQDHRSLAGLLGRFQYAPIVARYEGHPLIRELYPADRWHWIDAQSRTQSNAVRGEVWITRNASIG